MRKLTTAAAALVGLWLGQAAALKADVKPHGLIGSGMVLQQGMKVPVWGTGAPFNVAAVTFQGRTVKAQQPGNQRGDWKVVLDDLKPGGPYEMTITGYDATNGLENAKKLNTIHLKEVYVGEVWVCSGQSNMEMGLGGVDNAKEVIAKSKNPQIRLFTVPKRIAATPQRNVRGAWLECNPQTVGGFSAVAYFFGRDLNKALNVPVGLIHSSWGGTVAEAWTSRKALEAVPELKGLANAAAQVPAMEDRYLDQLEKYLPEARKARGEKKGLPPPPQYPLNNPNIPTVLYNGMIAPLIPYGIRGAIWYQGESNAGRAAEYRTLFPTMIQNWRHDWHEGDFPFLFVQLAPWLQVSKVPQESAWAELREAQLLTSLHTPNTGMAVITDVGDPADIHPRRKEPAGARLALAARALAYKEKIVHSGPVFDKMHVEGDKAVLSFKHVGGGLEAGPGDPRLLPSAGGKLHGFAVCGKDHKFVNAAAEIKGDKVVIWSPQVKEPVAVRYGWANCPVCNLQNKEGIPASPFRTDMPKPTGAKASGPQKK